MWYEEDRTALNSKLFSGDEKRGKASAVPWYEEAGESEPEQIPHTARRHGQSSSKRGGVVESMDFEESECIVSKKHQFRRYFQDRGQWLTSGRKSTIRKWALVIILGILIGMIGVFVSWFTTVLEGFKLSRALSYMGPNVSSTQVATAFFTLVFISQFFSLIAAAFCVLEPAAAGSGIPEIKAYLNGINLRRFVRVRVLFAKLLGMCFSCASGLPLGKEGPMIHTGAILGAAISQGKTIFFGIDTSWTKFQDLRNDRSKRDFVTFGAAAGVAAAFSAPIGGILFTLEEGASFWSTTLTFRGFFCAMVTQLTVNILTLTSNQSILGVETSQSMFDFGNFLGFGGYRSYELIIVVLIGIAGGLLGSLFNHLNKRMCLWRAKNLMPHRWKRVLELFLLTGAFVSISFLLPLMYSASCTPIPNSTDDTSSMNSNQIELLGSLVQFQCTEGEYNQLASLYLTDPDTALQQLFHFQEVNGTSFTTFDFGPLFLFFIPYFLFATVTSGTLCPAGLFVPTLLSGAAFGRIIGHLLNIIGPGMFMDAGSYALIGAAAVLGGMSRMTIAGTVIIIEACGNNQYLLPLMLTFAAARYTGNAINMPMYDLQITLNGFPFLDGTLKTLGLLNQHPVMEIMARPLVTVQEINRVGTLVDILSKTTHSGFPVVNEEGRLCGFILRKTLCSIMKLKAFSYPLMTAPDGPGGLVQLSQAAPVFHDTLERSYPHYPDITDIELSAADRNAYLDVRAYMDTAPFVLNESSTIQRCYRFFRTMGLRHLIVVDDHYKATGIITRKDITEHRLERVWELEGDKLVNVVVDPIALPPMVRDLSEGSRLLTSTEPVSAGSSDSPPAPTTPAFMWDGGLAETRSASESDSSASIQLASNPIREGERDATPLSQPQPQPQPQPQQARREKREPQGARKL